MKILNEINGGQIAIFEVAQNCPGKSDPNSWNMHSFLKGGQFERKTWATCGFSGCPRQVIEIVGPTVGKKRLGKLLIRGGVAAHVAHPKLYA